MKMIRGYQCDHVSLDMFNDVCGDACLVSRDDLATPNDNKSEYWCKTGNGGMSVRGYKDEVMQGVYMCYIRRDKSEYTRK